MGRRKIEIKAIKDDRNRSVTFLKRKGGLFKKAHELSVLCSVDVAVIIFGNNKKLYEFSSGDINETLGRYQYVMQYGGAHEHKGPEDFVGKGGADDDDDDDEGAVPRDSHTPPDHAAMASRLQHSQAFQHMRQATPSASPPMPPYLHRGPSPQPQPGHLSRPSSRTHIRRPSSNLAPPQPYPSQAPPPQPTYAYMPNPPFYNPQPIVQHMAPKPPQAPPAPQFQYTHPQVQQFMQQEQRRQSMPPAIQQQQQQQQMQQPPAPQPLPQPPLSTPLQPIVTAPSPPPQTQNSFQSPPLPQPRPLHASAKHSIFTPIDDSQSMLAAHWGNSTMMPRSDAPTIKQENRSHSIDVALMSRLQPNGNSPPPPPTPHMTTQEPPQRTLSTSAIPTIPLPPRASSIQVDKNKPRLRVQIPSEHSDAGSATADSSPKDSTTGATPARASTDASHSSGVVLPPPSPSANSLLSAGATGPPNPFARPQPPSNSNSYGSRDSNPYNNRDGNSYTNRDSNSFNNRDNMETPISALPSRFVENGLLPSPSSFYPEWGFGRDSNMLPSPLNFQTPVVANGPSFARDDSAEREKERKRKTSEEGSDGGGQKRIKT